jgi:VIT1/CCC1 family predicted Fe2+/Mn2+ transporter
MGGNALRAAVLGANDGLCSNLSLVMGVAGASLSRGAILIAGWAGLLAGAFSMALGEWISVTSSRELARREIQIEADELAMDPQGEGEELRLIYEAKGLSREEASKTVTHLLSDRAAALDTLSREELGIDPAELGGSAWEAASFSFVLFALGAIPLIPFWIGSSASAIVWSVGLSAAALFLLGAAITLFTGRPLWLSGIRQLVLGLLAAGVTFAIGRLVGGAITH